MYESIRLNSPEKSSREIPQEYQTEIKALDQCCKHRTHCLIHDIVGFIKVRSHPPDHPSNSLISIGMVLRIDSLHLTQQIHHFRHTCHFPNDDTLRLFEVNLLIVSSKISSCISVDYVDQFNVFIMHTVLENTFMNMSYFSIVQLIMAVSG